jgi:hypothetical protein
MRVRKVCLFFDQIASEKYQLRILLKYEITETFEMLCCKDGTPVDITEKDGTFTGKAALSFGSRNLLLPNAKSPWRNFEAIIQKNCYK